MSSTQTSSRPTSTIETIQLILAWALISLGGFFNLTTIGWVDFYWPLGAALIGVLTVVLASRKFKPSTALLIAGIIYFLAANIAAFPMYLDALI